jgi:two-component system, NtrC family, response regulator AtoC
LTTPTSQTLTETPALRLLLIDDEKEILASVGALLRRMGHDVKTAGDGREGLAVYDREGADIIISDIRMPELDGLGVLRTLRSRGEDVEFIFITGIGDLDTAVSALREGAFDFFTKPVRLAELTASLERTHRFQEMKRARERADARLRTLDDTGDAALIGESDAMREVMSLVDRVAATDHTTVLIQGESGTGKELVARAVHERSPRAESPFISLNCTAVPDSLFESELFGHEKGAFTDAVERKMGMFELGSGGTLFLDEIADMSLPSQAKILRVLEERRMRRVGGVREVTVDVRLVAATNRDLHVLQDEGQFRQDLFYRLNVFTITLPPLRDRGNDVLLLAEHFLTGFAQDFRKEVKGIDADAQRLLREYAFPGNVRELRNLLERAVILCDSDLLSPAQFGDIVNAPTTAPATSGADLASIEEATIRQALEQCGGRQTDTARLLGIGVDALRYRLKKYGLR